MRDTSRTRSASAAAFLLGALALTGCGGFEAGEFLDLYKKKAEVVTVRNGVRVSTLALSPEYMAALRMKAAPGLAPRLVDSLKNDFSRSNYFRVSISRGNADESGQTGDVLSPALANGREAYSRWLDLLQNGLRDKCFLELNNGQTVFASTYALERDWGLSGETSFLFVFPNSWNGQAIPEKDASIVISEFGLVLGNVRHPVTKPHGIRLKI